MNYRIRRGDQEFGPYSLAELKQYISEGRIIPSDRAMSEGMEDWAPIAEVTGNVDVSAPVADANAAKRGPSPADLIQPPKLHWALVLLFAVLSLGFFALVWMFIQAAWARKVDPKCSAPLMFTLYVVTWVPYMIAILSDDPSLIVLAILYLACLTCYVVGIFSIRRAIHNYYRDAPFNLHLNGFLTFFLNVYYFQYHFTRIDEWHKTGVIPR